MTSKWFTSLISGVALVGVTLTSAFPAAAAEQAPDKNGPGVARVSIIQGSAVVQRGDSHTQSAAVRNTPLLPGDYISTGQTSRAEVQFDGETAVRLGGNVQARVTDNDPNNRRLQLADGTIEVGMVRNGRTIDVDTPSVTVRVHEAGDYRISIGNDGSTWVTVRRGTVDIVTRQQTYALQQGRTLVARGSASNPTITYTSAVAFDSFDDFNAQRDQTMVAALNASPNLNPSIAGYDNLDAYGQWQDVAGYGQAWVPNQTSGWAPYRDGSWAWEGGYGWTWVGAEPWGWAPYHYGRWFWANGYGWAWYPPASYNTPTWSPALVGFYGFGGGVGVGVSFGFGYPYVGWCPLAPYEAYYPWYPGWAWTGFGWGWPWYGYGGYGYGGYGGFYGGTRIVNITNITNIYRNFRHGGGSGTLIGHFRHGTIIGHTVAVTSRNLGRVGSIHGALPFRPTAANERFSGRSVAGTHFSRAFDSPRFASGHPVAARSSFAEQQRDVTRAVHATAASHQAVPVTRTNEATRHATPVTRGSEATMHGTPVTRGSEATMRGAEATRNVTAPTGSWARFDQARGEARSAGFTGAQRSAVEQRSAGGQRATSGMGARGNSGFDRSTTRNTERAPSDSWGRFSQARGNVSAQSYGNRNSYSRGESYRNAGARSESYGSSYSRGSYPSYSRNSYQRDPYAGSARGSYPSYSRQSYPSYSRQSYPSYSRQSYPSYSRQSYPTYSRGSYGSAPSYSRGSYGSAPSYSRGSYSAPRQSGGGGGGGAARGGGGGHRPPQ